MIPPITASLDSEAAARELRKRVDHFRRHGPIARTVIVLRVRERLGFVRPVICDSSYGEVGAWS